MVCLISLLACIIADNVLAESVNKYDTKLPGNEIKDKKHYNAMINLERKEDVKEYLENLNEKELLTAIAECSEELDKVDAYYEMQIFAELFDKKLSCYVIEEDYITIIKSPNYSYSFKIFMIDSHSFVNSKENYKNSSEFNSVLSDIFEDDKQNPNLRSYALDNIDDYRFINVDILKSILLTEGNPEFLKKSVLHKLSKIDEIETYKLSKDIVHNFNDYSETEVNVAIKLLLRVSDDTLNNSGDIDYRVHDIEKVIRETNNENIKHGAVIALADAQNYSSVKAVINNRAIIDDDSVIKYFIDKNYRTVESMLNIDNDIETIDTALTCAEIAPFKSFIPALEKLNASGSYLENDIRLKEIIGNINKSSEDRNEKWDFR